ncbi:MAG: DnaJ domain-containing protein [Anaerotruncus sp.]|nr:DnaJ domain-containing protein [Anaerotruncus sp.]
MQLSLNADAETVERAFRHLASEYHPDHTNQSDNDRFSRVVEAPDACRPQLCQLRRQVPGVLESQVAACSGCRRQFHCHQRQGNSRTPLSALCPAAARH